ncbi:MAG: hypothetical protein K8R53_15005 [Bacteroidales bacterium]|nr:hypothetical protein [Bacteroidales bacterium]
MKVVLIPENKKDIEYLESFREKSGGFFADSYRCFTDEFLNNYMSAVTVDVREDLKVYVNE